MSGYTGYIASSGYDLSLIFQGGTTNIITGFKLANGDDIATIFSGYSTVYAPSTGLISVEGKDVSTYFNGIIFTPIIFTPLTIEGCCLWMDANDSSKISPAPTNNSDIDSWTDKSINAYVFSSPTTSTAKPKFASSSQNSKSTIAFASASLQYFLGDPNSKSFALNTSSYALFTVFKKSSGTYASMYNKSLYGAVSNRIILIIDNNKLNCGFAHNNSTGKIPNTTNIITTYQIVSVIINRYAGVDNSYVNGTIAGNYTYTSDSTTDFLTSAYDTLIGAYNDTGTGTPRGGYYLNGNICEIISYKNTYDMTEATRQKVEGYLAYKWNLQTVLPTSHPYKVSYP